MIPNSRYTLLFLLGTTIISCLAFNCPVKFLFIKNQKSGLVLDASEYQVKLQNFTGSSSQLWTMEIIDRVGIFYFINKNNGNVLDIQSGAINGNNLITFEKHEGSNQLWYIKSDGSIVCPTGNLAVDVPGGNYSVGSNVIALPANGGDSQKFQLRYL